VRKVTQDIYAQHALNMKALNLKDLAILAVQNALKFGQICFE